MSWNAVFLVFLGGGLGSVLRYVFSLLNQENLPLGTFLVNLLGAFLIGFLVTLYEGKHLNESLRILFALGFAGGFTTFSTYTLELFRLGENGNLPKAFIYFFISNAVGILLVWLGLYVGKRLS